MCVVLAQAPSGAAGQASGCPVLVALIPVRPAAPASGWTPPPAGARPTPLLWLSCPGFRPVLWALSCPEQSSYSLWLSPRSSEDSFQNQHLSLKLKKFGSTGHFSSCSRCDHFSAAQASAHDTAVTSAAVPLKASSAPDENEALFSFFLIFFCLFPLIVEINVSDVCKSLL